MMTEEEIAKISNAVRALYHSSPWAWAKKINVDDAIQNVLLRVLDAKANGRKPRSVKHLYFDSVRDESSDTRGMITNFDSLDQLEWE